MNRSILFFFFFLIFQSHLFSQISYERVFSDQWYRASWQPSIDNDNNYYLPFFYVHEFNQLETWGGILKLNEFGETVDSVYIDQIEDHSTILVGTEISIVNDTLYCFGTVRPQNFAESYFVATKLDLDLNIIESVVIETPGQFYTRIPRSVEVLENSFILMAGFSDTNIGSPSSISHGVYFMEIGQDFSDYQIEYNYENANTVGFPLDFTVRPNGDYLLVNLWGEYNAAESLDCRPFSVFGQDLLADTTFCIAGESLSNMVDIDRFQDSLYIFSGNHLTHFDPDDTYFGNDLAVYKMDDNFNILDIEEIYTEPYVDTLDYSCTHCLDHFNESIYFASDKDVSIPYSNMENPSWIRLVKLDVDLNIVWEKFYGGDKSNFVKGIKATPDGGCIMLCESYDYETYPDVFKTDLRIIKVDGDGLVTGIPESSSLEIKSLLVYPNPSNGVFRTETSLREYRMIFFDKSGRIVHESPELSGVQELNLDHLSNGAYPYVVIDKAGLKIDDGKIVLME